MEDVYMLTALDSWRFVAGGSELWLLFWIVFAASYAAICLFTKKERKKALKGMISGLVLAELVVDLLYIGVYAVHPGFRMFGVGLVYGLIPYALVLLVCAVFEKIRCLHV